MEKVFFLNNLWLFYRTREKGLNNFRKGRLFPITNLDKIPTPEPTSGVAAEPTPEVTWEPISEVAIEPTKATKGKNKRKTSSLKLLEKFLNEIKNEEKNTNKQIFREYFYYSLQHFK